MDTSDVPFQPSSLLDISRFQNPDLHFLQSQRVVPLAKANSIHQEKNLIDKNSPAFIRLFLAHWQQYGLFFQTQSGAAIENDLCLRHHSLLPLDLLNMAQKVRLRLTQITQYLQTVKRFHLFKIKKLRGQRLPQRGRRVATLAAETVLHEMHSDWALIDEDVRSDRRRKFRQENRQARRWLIAASRLSFGTILICGSQLEQKLNKNSAEKQVVALAAHVAEQFPDVVATYHLLDGAARGLLNQEHTVHVAEIEPIIARIEQHLHSSDFPLLKEAFSPMNLNSLICLDEESDDGTRGVASTINPAVLDSDHPDEPHAS